LDNFTLSPERVMLTVAGTPVAFSQVKLSRHAVQHALSNQQQQQQQQQQQSAGSSDTSKDAAAVTSTSDAEAAHDINLMSRPVMVELEYQDVAQAADGW
jgi:hypothetical protein